MKKGTLTSYLPAIMRTGQGEPYEAILRYFFPEVITAFLLYSALSLFDAYLINQLDSIDPIYATWSCTNNLLHTTIKFAEAFCVGTTVLAGRFNGMKSYKQAGDVARDAFWLTAAFGFLCALFLYAGAHLIYTWHGVSPAIMKLGIPFIRLRAISTFFLFIYFGLVGFLRGIKNTTVPMWSFLCGFIVFALTDYALVLGKFGFSSYGLQGSAIASIAQNIVMVVIALCCILIPSEYRKFAISLLEPLKKASYIKELFVISFPVALDKVVFAFSYTWLQRLICPMGEYWLSSYCAVRDIEKLAIIPAIALAQVITLLVSNDCGKNNWQAIRSNVRKTLIIAFFSVIPLLILFSYYAGPIFSTLFDKRGTFKGLAAYMFPFVSIFVLFDLLQLILSGVLRGAGDVKTVMFVRIAVCIFYFWPISWLIARMEIQNLMFKFLLLYGLFYLGHAIMSVLYMQRLTSNLWHKKITQESYDSQQTTP